MMVKITFRFDFNFMTDSLCNGMFLTTDSFSLKNIIPEELRESKKGAVILAGLQVRLLAL